MKARAWFLVAMLLAAVLFVSASGVWAQPDGAIECSVDMTFDVHEKGVGPYWLGTASDCELAGTVKYTPDPARSSRQVGKGNVLHFYERFTIKPIQPEGGFISGHDAGVGVMANMKFNARGWVTAASTEWEHLVGYKYFEMGSMEFLSYPPPWPVIQVKDMVMRLEPAE